MSFLVPAIAGGASFLSSILGSNAQNKAAKQNADLYNNWLKQYMGTGQNLYGQAQAAGWNPFGPQTSTSMGQTSGTSATQGGRTYSNRPIITEEYAPLDALMRQIMTGRLTSGTGLPQGYAESQARAINESYAGADAAARNAAARRGLSAEQTYATASPSNVARAGALADMRAQLPLLARQLQNEDVAMTQGLQSAFGRGEKGQERSWQTGQKTETTSGSRTDPFGASDLAALMGILAPPQPFQSGATGISTVGAGIDSLGALLGFLASQQKGKTPVMSGYGAAGPPPTSYGYG